MRPLTEKQRQIAEIDATVAASNRDAARTLKIQAAQRELTAIKIELEQLAAVTLSASALPGRSSATGVQEDPSVRKKRKLLERHTVLSDEITQLEAREAAALQNWHSRCAVQVQQDADAALRAEFEEFRQQALETQFQEWKKLRQGRA